MLTTHSVRNLTIGCFASICRGRLSDLLIEHADRRPATELGVVEMGRSGLLSALRTGEIDLAIVPSGFAPGFDTLALWSDPLVVAVPARHRLAHRPVVRWSDLKEELLLVSRRDYGLDLHRVLLDQIGPGQGPPSRMCELDGADLLRLVAEGQGLSLACRSAAHPTDEGVIWKDVEGACVRIDAIWRPFSHAPDHDALIATLRAHFKPQGR